MRGLQTSEYNETPVEIVQVNLNHCDTAQQLLWQSVAEHKCDVAIISEPYRIPPGNGNWTSDRAKTTAIWTVGKYPLQEVVYTADEGFVIAKINGVFICSCYAPPRWTIEQFNQMLDKLTEELTDRRPAVIAGDFNAWAIEWGSRLTSPRGSNLLEALAKLNVDLANEGTISTYRREGRESIIDVTFCSPGLIRNWRVHEGYTHSDHQAIRYRIGRDPQVVSGGAQVNERRWKIANFNKDVFAEALRLEAVVNPSVDELIALLSRACDATMPREGKPRHSRPPAYWWNSKIADLRANCHRARRRMQRARNDAERAVRRPAYTAARAALNREIKLSKKACLEELCRNANSNPWGDAYRVAMAKIRGPAVPPERCPEKMKAIVDALFPQHELTGWPPTPYGAQEDQEAEARITNEELITIAKALKTKKAPGPDGIPNVAVRTAILTNPELFRITFQRCINDGNFPDIWKRQNLVLLPKPGKPPGDPSAYRPICLLDTVGKVLERVILNRLTKYTEGEHGLSDMQFGFRRGRSTVDAIRTVVEAMQTAQNQKRRGNRYCGVITLDVKNAFNSASWVAIADALHKLRVPEYLCSIMSSYFQNRTLIYDTDNGRRSKTITAGVPQGSILGPTLWNAMYDEVLKLRLPRGVKIIGFADDVALLVIGESLEEVEVLATEAIDVVENWMRGKKLALAHHKTEMVLISNRKAVQQARISVGECIIESKRNVRHLGVMLDDRLNFNSHVDYACERAAKVISALSRIMPNNSAISSSKKRLLASVSTSVLRYAAPVWVTALQTRRNRSRLNSTFRLMAMRVCSAYRTISSEAVYVIAGTIPIDLLLEEENECYRDRGISGVRRRARADTVRKWQQQWDNAENGRWTHRLIPNVSTWLDRKHGEVNFHLTQFLSGHGCFRKYLHRFGHAESPLCPACPSNEETPEHVLFHCPRFRAARDGMLAESITSLSPDNIVERMCREESTWNAVNRAVGQILSSLQRKWREDQRASDRDRSRLDPPSGTSPSSRNALVLGRRGAGEPEATLQPESSNRPRHLTGRDQTTVFGRTSIAGELSVGVG